MTLPKFSATPHSSMGPASTVSSRQVRAQRPHARIAGTARTHGASDRVLVQFADPDVRQRCGKVAKVRALPIEELERVTGLSHIDNDDVYLADMGLRRAADAVIDISAHVPALGLFLDVVPLLVRELTSQADVP
jgi:hypothetical protein